ncbi:MAG: serine/threonine protein kinase [Candidatus Obscuribacterales bacterium]|nr:serine/threonine protein kinase [Candidatus Obscuribacterales bacterium]
MSQENSNTPVCENCRTAHPAGVAHCPVLSTAELLLEDDQLIGTIFADKYEILSLLGEGGMSRVYKARHTFMKRSVAVKILHESATDNVIAKARFQLEAEAASALSHPNVVTVHDYGLTPSQQAYFVMDCLEGQNLSGLLEQVGYLNLQEAVEIFAQACEGLDHAHRKGIIHRDIKPSNLVLLKQEDGSNQVKLVDFGIAKLVTIGKEESKKKPNITQTGEIFGTPAYMSPEQCCGRALDARADIYSFGCLMYEVLSGQPPFRGENFVGTAVLHVNNPPVPLGQVAKVTVPAPLEAVIMKCLEKDPAKRYASAAELKQALFDAALVSGLKGLRVGAVPEPKALGISSTVAAQTIAGLEKSQVRVSKKGIQIGIAILLLLIVGATGMFFYFPGPVGDSGTLFEKFRWQWGMAAADGLIKEGHYRQAAETLEKCESIARGFGDNNRRLEATLMKLVEVYGPALAMDKLEKVNNELVTIANSYVYQEYDYLSKLLAEWEQPTESEVKKLERAQQASAFGERIARCADKLSVRSRTKQELLLKKAAKAYDRLDLREGIYRTKFRIQLAQIYQVQQRQEEQLRILEEALKHSSVSPQTQAGWQLKIQVNLQLGIVNCDMDNLEQAKLELEQALEWSRAHHSGDGEQLRDCMNALVQVYRKMHTAEFDSKAAALSKEAKAISTKLDDDEVNSKD